MPYVINAFIGIVRLSVPMALLYLSIAPASMVQAQVLFSFSKVDQELLAQTESTGARMERQGLLHHDQDLEVYVNRVGKSMVPPGPAPEGVKWAFYVVRDPMPNAFAMPNGSVYVTSGLLSLLENEDQLAAVLAHEITHVTDRHSYLYFRSYRTKSALMSVAELVARSVPSGSGNWGALIQTVSQNIPILLSASLLGYSRTQEKDADIYSYEKVIQGSYDPRELPKVFKLLERRDEAETEQTYYSDHPKLDDRIAYMTTLIQEKNPPEVASEQLEARRIAYLKATEPVSRTDIELAIGAHMARTGVARAHKLVAFDPSSDNYCSLAEAYQGLGPWQPQPGEDEFTKAVRKSVGKAEKKFTPEELWRSKAGTPEGSAAWEQNQKLSEENYQKALALDPSHGKSYRGLGELYEKQKKNPEAVAAYRKYLEIQPDALDQMRIKQRIEALQH